RNRARDGDPAQGADHGSRRQQRRPRRLDPAARILRSRLRRTGGALHRRHPPRPDRASAGRAGRPGSRARRARPRTALGARRRFDNLHRRRHPRRRPFVLSDMTCTNPDGWPDETNDSSGSDDSADSDEPGDASTPATLPGNDALAATSHAQEALWFIDRLHGPSDLYHVTQALRLTGTLDVDALELSLATLVERHACLRTGFRESDGQLVQVVHAEAPVRIERLEAAGASAAERDRSLHALLQQGTQRPFDLLQPPLLRARLVRVADNEHVLLLVAHHIVTDGWSIGIVAREIGTLYREFAAGRRPSLPPLEARFVDFV